ncbi:hypothetical protein BWI96_11160 [Siphonobacter sp. SORGH_AS_0500]|uniref:TonB-dependent receptor plug domain-containing protein n=1 Tax=Siphonobacter sp. SORGH_AS_0500 TaxID=1864824 RepID=UPI000CC7A2E9|nr:TonB-dependent receptor plug domain-containing protein [Siphonobacter sp. SORGH_AS_0500]PKK36412.1 hypothetical protein BWI96_11160 [Siphonobacter sp. SORGH_AS_0500]
MQLRIFPLLLGSLCLVYAFVADDPLTRIISQFDRYHQQFPQEKVYLHCDRSYYALGESIWFKGYLFDASSHQSDTVSKVLYVDLINATEGKILLQKRLLPQGGTAEGDFYLADTLREGVYQLRAYTNWMRNFDEDFFFTKEFRVYQPSVTDRPAVQINRTVSLTFFPEGGTLVDDIESRVAFNAVDALGQGVDVEGVILENDRDTITVFQSEHLGMGRISLQPKPGKTYTAVLKDTQQRIPLPAAQPEGHVLIVDNLSNKEFIRIFVFNQLPKSSPKPLYVLAQMRGEVMATAKGNTEKSMFVANIPRNKFSEGGIVHLTLFDEKGEPLAERLVYLNNPGNSLDLSIKPTKTQYKPREKVTLELEAKDRTGRPVLGEFSLAVTDAGQVVPDSSDETLVSYLLMSSDLKGRIEQPGYYFNPNNPNAIYHLDLLLMTQGWRRFVWKQVNAGEALPTPHLIERGFSLEGKVTRPRGQIIEKKSIAVTLLMRRPNQETLIRVESAEADGSYGFHQLSFGDSTRVMIQAVAGKNDRNVSVTLNPFPQPTVRITKTPFQSVEMKADEFMEYLNRANQSLDIARQLRLNKAKLLKEITVKAKKVKESDSRKIYGTPDNTVKFDDMNTAGAISIFQVLQGRVPGMVVTGSGFNYTVQIRGAANFNGAVEPLFVLDGMPVDKEIVNSINPRDVDYVDVLKGAAAAIYGSRGGGGVVSILTKRGSSSYDPSKEVVPGQLIRTINGYAKIREFYSPDYSQDNPENYRPDYRPTLYWNPRIKTDENGKATVTFWNSDHETHIQARLEGTSGDGRVGTTRMTYLVK